MTSPWTTRATRIGYLIACIVFMVVGARITLKSWQSTLTSDGIERAYFKSVIDRHESDYLYKLRDTHLGCKTLTYRDPDIAFVGDSHNYAGWDYVGLQQRLQPFKIGNCALAGMFPENLADFANLVTAAGLSTRFVVFGIQPRMFWDVPERSDRVARARQMMVEVRQPRENLPALLNGHWRQIDSFLGAAQTEPRKIDALADAIRHLDDHVVDQTLSGAEHDLYALDFWLGYVKEGGPLQGVPALADKTCRAVRRAGLHLAVVYVPESRWLNRQYTAEQRRDFVRNAELFRPCADWIDLSAFDSYGYENRYFVNRYLVDNYPYSGWRDVAIAERWIGEAATERRWQFFDPDHMSAAGAREFSQQIGARLEQWLRGEAGDQP
jgi:hypothetical protein